MSGEQDHEIYRRRRSRNWAVAGVLGALAVALFAVTVIKLQENATNPMTELFDPQLRYRDQTPEDERQGPTPRAADDITADAADAASALDADGNGGDE